MNLKKSYCMYQFQVSWQVAENSYHVYIKVELKSETLATYPETSMLNPKILYIMKSAVEVFGLEHD